MTISDQQDAERYRYIRDALVRLGSPKMDNQHYWHFGTLKAGRGPTFDAAIDMEMRERPVVAHTSDGLMGRKGG